MEKSNKRGKIPQSDWPLIMARYEAGETLASIARTYDCSPPAISYVVSKSRARQSPGGGSAAGPSGPEAQLIKGKTSEPAVVGPGRHIRPDLPAAPGIVERRAAAMSIGSDAAAVPAPQPANERSPQILRDPDGPSRTGVVERGLQPSHAQTSGAAGNGRSASIGPASLGSGQRSAAPPRSEADTRHRLHLPLGNGATPYNTPDDALFPPAVRSFANVGQPSPAPAARPPSPAPSLPAAAGFSEAGPHAQPLRSNAFGSGRTASGADPTPRKDSAGAFIDHELRARVDTDIAAFLAAFDAALIEDTQGNRSALREATDRLLRAGARTRIELERLEARVPLSTHDRAGGEPGAWRYR